MAITNNFNALHPNDRQDANPSWLDRLAARVEFSSPLDARTVIEEALVNDDGATFSPRERAMT